VAYAVIQRFDHSATASTPRRQLTAEELADIISKAALSTRERPRNHTPDGLKWRVNESDKVEFSGFTFELEYFLLQLVYPFFLPRKQFQQHVD